MMVADRPFERLTPCVQNNTPIYLVPSWYSACTNLAIYQIIAKFIEKCYTIYFIRRRQEDCFEFDLFELLFEVFDFLAVVLFELGILTPAAGADGVDFLAAAFFLAVVSFALDVLTPAAVEEDVDFFAACRAALAA
ncbi:MAG: hypothetical protein R2857_09425 [Vampirovibrionales bacterium]